jgi:hypothetical protein
MHKTTLSLLLAGAALVASSAAFAFNPQPDPPGKQHAAVSGAPVNTDFNPQPDPPGRHGATACPQAIGKPSDAASGLPSGKRTVDGNTERKSGGQNFPVAGAGSSGGEACGFEQPK